MLLFISIVGLVIGRSRSMIGWGMVNNWSMVNSMMNNRSMMNYGSMVN